MTEYIWPECFAKGMRDEREFCPDDPPEKIKALALADQLSAWAICHSGGGSIPETFGHTMAMLSRITGAAGPEQCSEAAKAYL